MTGWFARYINFLVFFRFKDAFGRLLHGDESYYALQLVMGADKFPGPILRFISCGISNQLKEMQSESRLKQQISAWIQLLTCKRATQWNEDKFALHLLGVIVRIAFANDPHNCLELVSAFVSHYQALFNSWANAPKGMFGWLTTQVPPRLISTSLMDVSPWVTYLMLQAEPQIYSAFYSALQQNLGKHADRTLDETVKRASSKSNVMLGVEQLHYYRWLEFCTQESVTKHPVYPLALQQLCSIMFKRESFSG